MIFFLCFFGVFLCHLFLQERFDIMDIKRRFK